MSHSDSGPPDGGRGKKPGGAPSTARKIRRAREDERYLPVILKRTDETSRHPDDVLQAAIEEGQEQLNRPSPSLVLSAIAAGLILGFSAMAVAVVKTAVMEVPWPLFDRIAMALVYPFGFVVCLMSGVELFTEHTATAVYPVLDRRAPVRRLLKLWLLVGAGNVAGTVVIGLLLAWADSVVGARAGYLAVSRHFVGTETLPILASSLLAGWLMALGAWLMMATPPTTSQLLSIYIVTFLIGLGGLHHSIAGSAEVFTGYFLGDGLSLWEGLRSVLLAMAGNLVGGSMFVAGLNYGHIRESQSLDGGGTPTPEGD